MLVLASVTFNHHPFCKRLLHI